MKVSVYVPEDNDYHATILHAFAKGVVNIGYECCIKPLNRYKIRDHDVAAVFGVAKKAVAASQLRGNVIEGERSKGRDVIVLERGYVKREQYHSLGLNGINGNAVHTVTDMPSDRWRRLGVSLKARKKSDPNDRIVLIGQVPWDASVQHTNHSEWLDNTVRLIREYSDRKIIYRPHPLAVNAIEFVSGATTSTRLLEDDLQRAHAVVTFNSNVGVDAICRGVPAFCCDPGSMIYNLTNDVLSNIESPSIPKRDKWAHNLAYSQWNLHELENGSAAGHILHIVNERKEDAVA